MIDFDKAYEDFAKGAKISDTDLKKLKYTVNKFPSPELVIENIKQEGIVELQNVAIKFSMLSVLQFNHKVSDIEIEEAIVHLSNSDFKLINHDEIIADLINKGGLNVSAKIDKLILMETNKSEPINVEHFVFLGNDKLSKFTGSINSIGNIEGEFKKDSDLVQFDLTINNSGYKLNLQETYDQSGLKGGKVTIVTSNLIQELKLLLPDLGNFSENIANEDVKITFDIERIQEWLNLKNIVIDSKSIAGDGIALISKNASDIDDIKLNFSKIDINSLRTAKQDDNAQTRINFGASNKFDFKKNPMKAKIFAKSIQLDDHNLITDVNFSSFIQNGQLYVEDFSGIIRPTTSSDKSENNNLEKIGEFRMNGIATQNSFRSLFTGKFALVHDDLNDLAEFIGGKDMRSENKIPYSIVSDLKFSSVDISMQNLTIKTPDVEISGNVSTKFIGNAPRTSANLKFNKINLDKKNFPALSQIYQYGINLTEDSKKDDYLSKFIPLRKINSTSSYDIAFDKIIVNNTEYKHVALNLSLDPGRVRLENLTFENEKNKLDLSIDLLASGIKPSFNLVIHSGILDTQFLSPSASLALKQKILENYALDKVDINMSIFLNKLSQGDFDLNNVFLRAKNNKSLFEISHFDADILGGKLISSGSILLEPYTLNFVYALNSANIETIARLLPKGVIDSGGAISASGMWSTNGNKLEELLYNLYTKSNIITKDITVNNFSIDDLITATNSSNYNSRNFNDDLKRALLTGKTTISDLKSSVELSKGIFTLQQIEFKTKYTAGSASANFNLYDLNLNLDSVFSFYLTKPTPGKLYNDYSQVKLNIKANGNFLNPKKEADSKAFEAAIQSVKKS